MPKPGVHWVQSFFRWLGWKWRAKTTGRPEIPEGVKKEAEFLFLYEIVSIIEEYGIPYDLVLNLDQTPKYIQGSRYTMTEKGTKSVLVASSDRRTITATFTVTLSGTFLGMQLIVGKLNEVFPKPHLLQIFLSVPTINIFQILRNHEKLSKK